MERAEQIALGALAVGAGVVAIFWLRNSQSSQQQQQTSPLAASYPLTGEVAAAASQPNNASLQQYVYELQREIEGIGSTVTAIEQQYPLAYPQQGQTILQQILQQQQALQNAIVAAQSNGQSAIVGTPSTSNPTGSTPVIAAQPTTQTSPNTATPPYAFVPPTPLTSGNLITYQQWLQQQGQWVYPQGF